MSQRRRILPLDDEPAMPECDGFDVIYREITGIRGVQRAEFRLDNWVARTAAV
jgi:hypothetical protein